jgi:opacity protein-like surface antigen
MKNFVAAGLSIAAGLCLTAISAAAQPAPVNLRSGSGAVMPIVPSGDIGGPEANLTGWQSKLRYHAENTYSPWTFARSAAYAGYLQEVNSPREWGQGGRGYRKRFGSEMAYTGVRNSIAFGLDSTLHQDPRYYRSDETGFWRRTNHAIRGTILTRTDSGAETLATWRIGSAYGAAFISNEWRPDRVNTVSLSLQQGTSQIGFDLLANMSAEFWPDVRRKVFRHKP